MPPDTDDMAENIRSRAYELWQAAGSPEGKQDDFWLKAERELAGVESSESQAA